MTVERMFGAALLCGLVLIALIFYSVHIFFGGL